MNSERSLDKTYKKLNLTVQTSYTSLHSTSSRKKFLTVITPSSKPTRKNRTFKQIKLQVTGPKQTTILPVRDIVKDKQAFTKQEGLQRIQKWQQTKKLEPKNENIPETTIGADSAFIWKEPQTPISKLISQKHCFKQ